MAKEMMIIFVYDTQMLQKEEDDPASAILYFHPTWVSDQQKTALCGQLMGTVHCIKSILSTPRIISLQSGKFFVKEYGRYLMAVGTDRNIADWLLEHRAKTMSSLLSFFHEDLGIMAKVYDNNAKFSAKLYQLFETYIKSLFLGGNIFSYVPLIKLPKSASNVFLESIQILQCCQELNHVLGGALFYHNKVVATQLSPDVTKHIVLTDPYRIKCPAEIPIVNFDLPMGAHLFHVYVPKGEYSRLHDEALRNRTIFQSIGSMNLRKTVKPVSIKEPVISAIKRDQSLIFTSVPEEDFENPTIARSEISTKEVKSRPKFLNLKNKFTDFIVEKPNIKPIPSTPFYGQTSICSTPMTELSKVIHSKPMSICIDPEDTSPPEYTREQSVSNIDQFNQKIFKPLYVDNAKTKLHKSHSVLDLRYKEKDKNWSISNGKKTEFSINSNGDATYRRFKTIADPNYPIFRPDGTIVSHPFYEDILTNHMELLTTKLTPSPDEKNKTFEDFDFKLEDFVKSIAPVSRTIPFEPYKISKEKRKSLTLPLKSLSMDTNSDQASPIRRHSSGVMLTPLMSKLSNFDDRSSGFCSRDTTPSEYKVFTPTAQLGFPFSMKKSKKLVDKNNDTTFQKCILFICGQQDMVVSLLLEEDGLSSQELVTKLWEICTENLGKLEKQLHHCLQSYPGTNMQNDSEPYSYLYLDSEWDTIHRGGPWGSADLGALTYFHRDFKQANNLTEILMRCSHGVIYGYQCGKAEVFYHQAASENVGLPTPADPMGNIPLKAKRRLERDHSIILL